MDIADVRPSPIAGVWYSGDADRLRSQMNRFIDEAILPMLEGEVVAVIAPHAGHRYSGRTAGYAFSAVRGASPNLVTIVSPMHAPYPATLVTTAHRAYSTPLGQVQVDQEALRELDEALAHDGIDLTPVANDSEHSLEIELPFLQVALSSDFHLLPIMVRSQSPLVARRLGHAIARVAQKRKSLLVASTDLSHFYPIDMANDLDQEMLRRINAFSPDELFNAERTGKGFACGVAAVAAVLWAARELGANKVEVLHHSTSADETGDNASVVGYGAAVVLKHV